MKTILLIIFLLVLPVSKELIYNTGFYRSNPVMDMRYDLPVYPKTTIRKVKGYDNNGNTIGDNNGRESDFWLSGYEYYWDGSNWYRKDGDGNWQKYINTPFIGWHWAYFGWFGYHDKAPDNSKQGYLKNPLPVGSPICLLLFAGYYTYRKRKNEICLG